MSCSRFPLCWYNLFQHINKSLIRHPRFSIKMSTLTKAVVKQMSAHKLTNKVVGNGMGLGIGLHRRFHTTQRKPFYEDRSSQFMGNKPYENDRLFMFQEMFSNMNKEHSNRFSAVEKDIAKCHRAVQDLGLSLTRLESKLDTGRTDTESKILNAVRLTHGAGSGFLSRGEPMISNKGLENINLVIKFIIYILLGQFIFNLGRDYTTALDKIKTKGEESNGTNDNNNQDKKK